MGGRGTPVYPRVVGGTLFHPGGGRRLLTTAQNSEKFESTTEVLPSVYRTAGPMNSGN